MEELMLKDVVIVRFASGVTRIKHLPVGIEPEGAMVPLCETLASFKLFIYLAPS
jgi:hypothetical protein